MINHYAMHQSIKGSVLVKAFGSEDNQVLLFSADIISPEHLVNLFKSLPIAPVEVRKAYGNELTDEANAIRALGFETY